MQESYSPIFYECSIENDVVCQDIIPPPGLEEFSTGADYELRDTYMTLGNRDPMDTAYVYDHAMGQTNMGQCSPNPQFYNYSISHGQQLYL